MIGDFNLVAALLGAFIGTVVVWVPGYFLLRWVMRK